MFGLGAGFDCYVMNSALLADRIIETCLTEGVDIDTAACQLGIDLDCDLTRSDFERLYEEIGE